MQLSPNLHFKVILQLDLRWPLTLIFDLLTAWTEGSHIILTNQVWSKSDFNFSNEAIFTFSAYLTTWPQMTFDLEIWPLTAWTYEDSHIISINQVWFKVDFNFSNEATFTFSAYLTTWPQMTLDLDMWSLTSSTYEGSHVASMTQLWLKSIKACGKPNVNPVSQQTTTEHKVIPMCLSYLGRQHKNTSGRQGLKATVFWSLSWSSHLPIAWNLSLTCGFVSSTYIGIKYFSCKLFYQPLPEWRKAFSFLISLDYISTTNSFDEIFDNGCCVMISDLWVHDINLIKYGY